VKKIIADSGQIDSEGYAKLRVGLTSPSKKSLMKAGNIYTNQKLLN
jgi:hypothetical protein